MTQAYDPELALAQLEGAAILIQHHIRQAVRAHDWITCREFSMRLGKLYSDVEHARKGENTSEKKCEK